MRVRYFFGLGGAALAGLVYGCAGGGSTSGGFTDAGGGGEAEGGIDASPDRSSPVDSGTPPPADAQTCTHNDDCTGPNLCTSGYQCLGGLCIPTGMPQSCDDGVPCTQDSCSAQTNQCVHTPVDANCPNGETCDPMMNCVSTLPCMPGDSVCERLDTNACAGLWTCDPNLLHCVQQSPPCQSVTNATTQCTSLGDGGAPDGGADVKCAWTCDSGYVHVVWKNGAPSQETGFGPPPPSGGCECQQMSGADKPDLGFVDSNCDGIDGTI